MDRPKFICLKRAVIGFVASCLAVTVTVWAMQTYVPQSARLVFAIGAAFATFYCMTLSMRSAVQEAYHAGEVGRRLPARRGLRAIESKTSGAHSSAAARTVFSAGVESDSRIPAEPLVARAAGHDDPDSMPSAGDVSVKAGRGIDPR